MFKCLKNDCAAFSCSKNNSVCWMLDQLEIDDPMKAAKERGINLFVDESAVNLVFGVCNIIKKIEKFI